MQPPRTAPPSCPCWPRARSSPRPSRTAASRATRGRRWPRPTWPARGRSTSRRIPDVRSTTCWAGSRTREGRSSTRQRRHFTDRVHAAGVQRGAYSAAETAARPRSPSRGPVHVRPHFAPSPSTTRPAPAVRSRAGTTRRRPAPSSFEDGETSKTFTVPILATRWTDGPRTVNLALSNLGGGRASRRPGHRRPDHQRRDAAALQFSAASFTVIEGAGTATITVTRTGGSARGVACTTRRATARPTPAPTTSPPRGRSPSTRPGRRPGPSR